MLAQGRLTPRPPVAMDATLQEIHDRISTSMPRYAEVTRRSSSAVLKRAMRGATRRVIAVSPPGWQDTQGSRQTLGRDAYQAGAVKIRRQMLAVLAPRTLKRKRRERWPDVISTYRARRVFRNNGVGVRISKGPGPAYVDRVKFNLLLDEKKGRIGRFAAGWAAGAGALGVPLPAWVSRHGAGGGMVRMNLVTSRMSITVANFGAGAPHNVRTEMRRRIPYALRYQAAAMQREVDFLVHRGALQHAIRTRNFSALVPAGMQGGDT